MHGGEGFALGGGVAAIEPCRLSPPIGTSRTSALAISRSSATHQSLPVPEAKSLVDIDGERRGELAHHRQREIAVVAIAVVEGEAGKAAREVALAHPAVHLVERDDVDVEAADVCERRAQESGVISRCRFGWNASARAGRTWCSMKMVPTPANKGRSRRWAPLK